MIPPPVTTHIIPPTVFPQSGKVSLSTLQLKHLHRATSIGSTDDDDDDTTHRYPSMVSSEYEDEGGTSTLDGTINYPTTDDGTTLGGGPSFDFSVSACMDDESLKDPKEKRDTTTAAAGVTSSRSNPIVYSNVGQAFSRGDMIPTQSLTTNSNHNIPKPGPRFMPPMGTALDRPIRRRSSSTGKRSLSTPPQSSLEVIDEHLSHDHKLAHLQENASEPSSIGGQASVTDTMVVISLADGSASSSRKQQPSSNGDGTADGPKEENVRVVRRLDSVQIGIILLISVALAAVICATFCVVGSCHVGKNKNSNNRVLMAVTPIGSQTNTDVPTHYLRTDQSLDTITMLMLPP
jgi:hypothetical protein